MKINYMLPSLFLVFFLTGCSSSDSSGGSQMDYDQTKKMVVDILKTDDGKKAIQDVMSDEKMKEKLVMDQKVVSDTIQQTLTSDKAVDFWKKAFSDAKFAESVAKNMRSENEKLLKDLMNDPAYRAMMVQVFKEPEIQKEMADALKDKDFRAHLQGVISETLESPLFKTKMEEILIKAANELNKGKTSGSSGSQSQADSNQQNKSSG